MRPPIKVLRIQKYNNVVYELLHCQIQMYTTCLTQMNSDALEDKARDHTGHSLTLACMKTKDLTTGSPLLLLPCDRAHRPLIVKCDRVHCLLIVKAK